MQVKPTLLKRPANTVRYGEQIARHGYVWCAYSDDVLIAVAATVGEARRLYREALGRYFQADLLAKTQRRDG